MLTPLQVTTCIIQLDMIQLDMIQVVTWKGVSMLLHMTRIHSCIHILAYDKNTDNAGLKS